MWVILNNSFLSIVEHRDKPDMLMVRARFKGDIEAVFAGPGVKVKRTPDADYLFRAELPRDRVAQILAAAVNDIDYPNFKNSVKQHWRHELYAKVWGLFWREQKDRASLKGGA